MHRLKLPRPRKIKYSCVGILFVLFFCNSISIANSAVSNPKSLPKKSSSNNSTVPSPQKSLKETNSISSNPASVNITSGIGNFNCHGVRMGGAWIADANYLSSGGIPHPKRLTGNNLLIANLTIDTKKFMGWEGGLFSVEFLQFDGQHTNAQAGVLQGYNGLPGPPPLNRSELYQLWYRQEFFNKKLIIRVGKTVPVYDFENVIKPIPTEDKNVSIPAVSGLIFTPLFVNPTMLGVMPGYYNSAWGVTTNFAPTKHWYFSEGIYDGSSAKGVQTGIQIGPSFDGSSFNIGETGLVWLLGKNQMPGNIGVGAWHQSGKIRSPPTINETSASGYYLFGSQRVWYKDPSIDDSGISTFYQYGVNNSKALYFIRFVGGGLTAFGLIPSRFNDSMGVGTALSWLNPNIFRRRTELMYQAYYQANIVCSFYLEPVISYIPAPAAPTSLNAAWAGTLRAILLF